MVNSVVGDRSGQASSYDFTIITFDTSVWHPRLTFMLKTDLMFAAFIFVNVLAHWRLASWMLDGGDTSCVKDSSDLRSSMFVLCSPIPLLEDTSLCSNT